MEPLVERVVEVVVWGDMTATTSNEGIMKVDCMGRVRTPPERREALLDEHERSGMSGAGFARHYGIKEMTFADWIQKRRRKRTKALMGESSSKRDCASQWLEAVIEPREQEPLARTGLSLEVHLPCGARMVVSDQGQIGLAVELLRALGK